MSGYESQELSTTAFGELKVESVTPLSQISAQYGLLDNVLTVVDNATSGTASIIDNKFTCQTGASATGLSSILTLRQLSYRAGQGALARFTALFDTPVADNSQAAGLITAENSFVFGYAGVNFGIIHAFDGQDELQELELTVTAGAETATVTVNGVAYPVLLAGLGATWQDAYELSLGLSAQVPNYTFTSNGNKVMAQSVIPGPQGSFAYSSAGSSVGAWTQINAGIDTTQTFIPQAKWNIDTRLDGDEDSILNPQLGNVYQIQFQYLGFGAINFFVEDKVTGEFCLVHKIQFANTHTTPSVSNPTFRVGWYVQNMGNASNVSVQGSSAGMFIEGATRRDTPPQAESFDQLSVSNTATNILSIRNRVSFGGKVNRAEIFPLLVNASTQANKVTFFRILLNPTYSAPVNFSYHNEAGSLAEVATDKVFVTGGRNIGTLTVGSTTPTTIRFNITEGTDTAINPGTTLAFVAATTAASGDCQVSATWQEDL